MGDGRWDDQFTPAHHHEAHKPRGPRRDTCRDFQDSSISSPGKFGGFPFGHKSAHLEGPKRNRRDGNRDTTGAKGGIAVEHPLGHHRDNQNGPEQQDTRPAQAPPP